METFIETDWLLGLGYWGLLLGTFIAGTILTLSSDVLLIAILLAGGNPWICLGVATLGNGSGAMVSYFMARAARWQWIERWFRVKVDTLEKQKAIVARYGVWCALFSWLPMVGQLFMLALGFYKARVVTTALFTYAGCFGRFLVWTLLYISCGERFIEWLSGWLG